MNRDPLEDFIHKNRQSFEESFDTNASWRKMQERRTPKKVVGGSGFSWLQVAALLFITLGVVTLLRFYDGQTEQAQPMVVNNYHLKLGDLSPELAEVEEHYTSAIRKKMDQAKALNVDDGFASELKFIDDQQAMLVNEMKENVNNSKVVEAMIQNYRMKLRLLEEMLEDIENEKNKKQNDKSNKTIET